MALDEIAHCEYDVPALAKVAGQNEIIYGKNSAGLSDKTAETFSESLFNSTVRPHDDRYQFAVLPCFNGLRWPASDSLRLSLLPDSKTKITESRSLQDGLRPLQRDARIETFNKSRIATARKDTSKLRNAKAAIEFGIFALCHIEIQELFILIQDVQLQSSASAPMLD
jgi:hypothetical protein